MKSLLVFVLLACGCAQVLAQGFILSGQVTDANNEPMRNMEIKVTGGAAPAIVKTNKDGLYYTAEIPAGDYDVAIMKDYKVYVSKVHIGAAAPKKRFYNFKIEGKNAVLNVSDDDVFAETAYAKARKRQNIDAPPNDHNNSIEESGRIFFIQMNSGADSLDHK